MPKKKEPSLPGPAVYARQRKLRGDVVVEFVCTVCAFRQLVAAVEQGQDPGEPPTFSGNMVEHCQEQHPSFHQMVEEVADLQRRLDLCRALALDDSENGIH